MRRWLLPTPGAHLVQLDSLRAFAVIGVLVTHYLPKTTTWFQAGFFGVRLFFVLSGFLITGILLRAGGLDRLLTLRQFYARRFLRIFPAFYLVLLVAAALAVPGIRNGFGWYAGYLSNFYFIVHFAHQRNNFAQPFWSLAVEEQFYLVAPAVVLFAPRRYLKTILLSAVAVAIAFRTAAVYANWNENAHTYAPTACLDSLGFGALLAVTRRQGLSDRWTRWALALGLPLFSLYVADVIFTYHLPQDRLQHWSYRLLHYGPIFRDPAIALVGVWLIARASRGFGGLAGKVLSFAPLVYIGTISYGIYLYHFVLIWAFQREFGWVREQYPNELLYFLVLSLATVAIATVSWFGFERPLNGLKRYFPYGERPTDARRTADLTPQAESS
jgi:peptidoglycan/LPS O-acetylase OafA/YrhL